MAHKIDYAALYSLRKDGRYQKRLPNGKYIYDRDPYRLWLKEQEALNPKEITFGAVAELWCAEHRERIENRTWTNYRLHYDSIVEKHGERPVREITANDVIKDLAEAKAKGYSATVISTRRSLFRMILDYAVTHDYIPYNPSISVRMPKGIPRGRRKAPDDDIIEVVLRNVDAPFGLFAVFLLCTGMRRGEALALTWGDVDLQAGEISITKSLVTAGGTGKIKEPKTEAGFRTVPIISILSEELRRRKGHKTDPLFPKPDSTRGGAGGGFMSERAYEGAWQRYCEAAGLVDKGGKPTLTAHQLRHATATLCFEAGVDELTAQRILGHADVLITRRIYTDLRANQKQSSVRRFDELMSEMMSKSLRPAEIAEI